MRSFLYFLLGFFLSISFVINFSHAIQSSPFIGATNNRCYYIVALYNEQPGQYVPYSFSNIIPNENFTGKPTNAYDFTNAYTATNKSHIYLQYHVYMANEALTAFSYQASSPGIPNGPVRTESTLSTISSGVNYLGSIGSTLPNLPSDVSGYCNTSLECPDSDSDDLCDACDQDPNDSTIGGDLYLKGYYEYNGEVVASLVSYSPNSTSYDHTRINKEYSGNITEVPGYVLGLGMPTHIRPDDFINGGGKFVGLIQPEKVTSVSCAPVTNLSSCNSDLCNFASANASAEKKFPEVGESIKPSTEQRQEDANYLYPEKTCDQYRSLCDSSCGGSPMVQMFACSEGSSGYKHVNCDCVHGGYYEIAPDWNSLGPQDESSTGEDDTGSGTSGTGTTTTGGGSSTSAGGDQDLDGDGTVDGSPYEYSEGKVDYSPVGAAFGRLGGRFPFSLRNTISDLYSSFRHSGAAPSYSYTIYGRSLTINLAVWNDIAQMVRSLFALGIVLSTILMLIYLYVGIDLRGKA